MADNITVLTQSHFAIAAKKSARHAQIKEVVFDEEARKSFLTGFHKRKVARREQAKKKAQLREKEERLETRREQRRALAERAARNAAEVEMAYGALAGGDGGEVASEREVMEEEYEGVEQLATVTVVQHFDLSTQTDGPRRPARTTADSVGAGHGDGGEAARRTEQRRQRRAGRKRKC